MNCDNASLLLYAVTDRSWLHGQTLYEQAEQALQGGATFLQLREKELDEAHFQEEAIALKALCRQYGVPFVLDDNVALAVATDADAVDAVTEANLDDGVQLVKTFAQRAGCIVAVTGAIDLVSDGERCWCIRNGRAEMSRITGTGCQLSALMTAFLVANPDHKLDAAAAAVCMMGLAGEIGWANMQPGDGNSTYRNRIIDAIFNMTGDALEKGAKYELR